VQEWLRLDLTKRAISYARFSSAPQAKGDSLRRQAEVRVRMAEAYGLELDEATRFADLNVSGWDGSNLDGALGEVIAAAGAGALPRGVKLIVESLDRISRQDPYQAHGSIRKLCDLGIIIVTADMQVYSKDRLANDPSSFFILQGILNRAHDESRTKSVRIRAVREAGRAALRDGKPRKATKLCPGWLRGEGNDYFEIPDRVETLKRVFDLAVAEQLGSTTIAKKLNAESRSPFSRAGQGLSDTRAAPGWTAEMVGELLRSRAPLGYWQPHTRDPLTGKRLPSGEEIRVYPIIIDETTWHAANEHIRKRNRTPDRVPQKARIANLLSGVVKCVSCGGRVTRHLQPTRSDGIKPFLICDAGRRAYTVKETGARICNGVGRHPYEPIEMAILIAVTPLLSASATRAAPLETEGAIQTAMAEVAASREASDRLARQIKRLMALDDDDPLLLDAVRDRKAAMARHKAAEASLGQARSQHAAEAAMLKEMNKLLTLVREGDDDARERLRNLLLHNVAATLHPNHIAIRIKDAEVTVDRKTAFIDLLLPDPATFRVT